MRIVPLPLSMPNAAVETNMVYEPEGGYTCINANVGTVAASGHANEMGVVFANMPEGSMLGVCGLVQQHAHPGSEIV